MNSKHTKVSTPTSFIVAVIKLERHRPYWNPYTPTLLVCGILTTLEAKVRKVD